MKTFKLKIFGIEFFRIERFEFNTDAKINFSIS
jgi:hypothetical protein